MAENLAALLRAAYAAECMFLDILKKYLEAAQPHDVRIRLGEHLVETQWQANLLGACLEFQGANKDIPDAQACTLAAAAGKTGLLAIKRFKIDLYKKIIAEARKQRAAEVIQACREILEQERAMAEWIEDYPFAIAAPAPVYRTAQR